MKKLGCLIAVILLAGAALFAGSHMGSATIEEDTPFIIPAGSSLTSVAQKLEDEGLITSSDGFLLRSKIFGGSDPIQAGEFMLSAGMSQSEILDAFQNGDVIRRFVTIPEGLPSILVYERLMAEDLLTGEIEVPEEGSILPDTYDFERGESRASVIARMQKAMDDYLAEAWEKRTDKAVVKSPEEALILASIVEKETAQADERPMVAGALSNRVRIGMMLGADATTIYPITKGKPLGRRIRVSELKSTNPYNTRAVAGLPPGPITNPGRESIAAVLDPAETKALYYVADGTGGHVFSETLEEHNRNAAKWRALRRERGEM
ncbi:endolytic transglycosylase MltG [Qipengyuania gelatinilytica]|uniref:Endolytic murein transglycosylase n=1 Tax=Qipengyuania gelatinilytica TaxID=2867231 RepID=A0ABX9A3D0_9SPHN|nr:endolytic transglycosylase MltG [Qipengyuania gelatinilytica]QZD95755.1 endolytic transglycosylase MltG [Qipengyuania gelatinilytica]